MKNGLMELEGVSISKKKEDILEADGVAAATEQGSNLAEPLTDFCTILTDQAKFHLSLL